MSDTAAHPVPRPPLRSLWPAVATAAVAGGGVLLWLAAGRAVLPGRWLALHLFTLGVLSTLVVALTDHFARTLLHARDAQGRAWRLAVLAVGVATLLAGRATGGIAAVAGGATLATAAVTWLYVDLRILRHGSVGSRFAFVVRGYERACGAFIHGALLGVLLGTGVLSGAWYGAARLAHLHVNLLGWGGVTLLATIVFFGPTMLRRRIADGAEEAAARALRWAPTGLGVATIALLLTGAGGTAAIWWRALAAAGLAVYAAAATRIWSDVARAARGGAPSLERRALPAVGVWFVLVVWADVAMVALGAWRYLDVLGTALLVGVLLQAIVVALAYLGPMLRGAVPQDRAALRDRLQRLPAGKAAVFNVGVVLLVVATAGDLPMLSTVGWALVATAVVAVLAPLAAVRRR